MRFHVGCSFSWRTIKKFLIPFIIGLLAFLGFSGIKNDSALGFIKVNALVNNNTHYELTMPNYDDLFNWNCGDENLKEVIDDLIDNYDDSHFNVVITNSVNGSFNNGSAVVWLVSKNFPNQFRIYGSGGKVYFEYANQPFSANNNIYRYSINSNMINCSNTNITNSTIWTNLLNAINTGVSSQSIDYNILQSNSIDNSTIDNTTDNTLSIWYYYSNIPFIYRYSGNVNGTSVFYKSLYINDNDTNYNFNDNQQLPSYYDIYHNDNPITSTFIEYKPKLGTIYTNFNTSLVSNFSLNIKFDTEDITGYDYFNNLEYTWGCYGRINNSNNYYTYEKFSYCDFEQMSNSSLDSNKFDVTFNNFKIYDQQDNIISNFSNYDKLFFYIDFQYKDSSLNQTLSSLNISFGGNSFFSDYFGGPIYENFDSLTLYSKLFISTIKEDYSYFEARYSGTTLSDRYFLYKQPYDLTNLVGVGDVSLLGTSFQRLSVNKAYNLGYLIFQQLTSNNSGLDLPKVDLLIFEDIVISLNNINSNSIYYVDSNGNITNGDISIQYDNISNNSYDLEYYIRIVYNFIDSYKDKIWDLHLTIQNFYDSTPALLQNTIYVLFILLCLTFIYKEIRR